MIKKYEQLYSELKEKILLGEYRAGEKLPSKRVMTDRTGYSQITVATAYGMLEDEGYIRTRQRSGYYVCEIDPGVILRTGQEIGFAPHLPEPAVEEETGQNDFEYSVWFRTVRKVISEKGALLFQKSPNQGCAVLRNSIADYLRR